MSTPPPGPFSGPPDTSRHRALAAASRVRMLHLVQRSQAGLTAAEVTDATGLHPSTVRAHLDQLVESGLLTRSRQSDGSPGRPAWRYHATPRAEDETEPAAGAGTAYRGLAAALIGHLARVEDNPHTAGVRAGRDWGRALAAPLGRTAPVDGLVQVLDSLGFTPAVAQRDDSDSAVLHLHTCPFLELAETNPDVVCGVHLGVIGGALGALGASTTDTDLEPFAAPGACVVRVRTAAAGSRTAPAGEAAIPGGRPDR
ncbi:helix-turn-helix transcriptional regulator [Planosporangium sp. 12N6]|uniref:helix-turn-helix transcriptional regulator n=1 Tax=Planosporangium spinosum TaxID=3402278 RepID=UPI003CE91845